MTDQIPSTAQEILAARAALLARRSDRDEHEGTDLLPSLIVRVGKERYAISLGDIVEIDSADVIVEIPGIGTPWLGLINQRGTLYNVVDLARFLNAGALADTESPRVVLMHSGQLVMGFAVDEVVEITQIDLTTLGPPLSERAGNYEVCIGITPSMVGVLDANKLLKAPSLSIEHEGVGR